MEAILFFLLPLISSTYPSDYSCYSDPLCRGCDAKRRCSACTDGFLDYPSFSCRELPDPSENCSRYSMISGEAQCLTCDIGYQVSGGARVCQACRAPGCAMCGLGSAGEISEKCFMCFGGVLPNQNLCEGSARRCGDRNCEVCGEEACFVCKEGFALTDLKSCETSVTHCLEKESSSPRCRLCKNGFSLVASGECEVAVSRTRRSFSLFSLVFVAVLALWVCEWLGERRKRRRFEEELVRAIE